MLQLQQLHEPLDVAERAAAKLQVTSRVGGLRQPFGLDARLDTPHLARVGLGQRCGIPHGVGQDREVAQKRLVARDTTSAQQRLSLPRERPALVVGAVRVERPHDRPVAPLGPEVDVEVERQAQVVCEALEFVHDVLGARLRVLARTRVAIDVHDISVGAEAELGSAVAAHRDDRELDAVAVPVRERQHSGEKGRRHVAQGPPELVDSHDVEDARESEAQHLTPAGRAQGFRPGLDVSVVAVDRRPCLVEQRLERARPQLVFVLEPRSALGNALEQPAHVARRREHTRQPLRRTARVTQHAQEPVRLAEIVAQTPEREQAIVGISALGKPLQNDWQQRALNLRAARHPAREGRDVVQSTARVTESDCGQAGLSLAARERETAVGQRGDGRQ